MSRIRILTFCLQTCIASLSCQSYTTGLQQSVTKTDETAAIAALHTIATAQQTYAVTSGGSYGTFQQLREGGYLDSRFSSTTPEVKGYILTMAVNGNSFSCNADPAPPGSGRHFYTDATSPVIHVNPSQPATAQDAGLQP